MTTVTVSSDQLHRDVAAPAHGGPIPKRIVVGYGFWIFLLSDIIMFAAFFAAYAVLVGETAGGPTGAELCCFAAGRSDCRAACIGAGDRRSAACVAAAEAIGVLRLAVLRHGHLCPGRGRAVAAALHRPRANLADGAYRAANP